MRISQKINFVPILLLFLLAVSCTTTRSIYIEIPLKAEKEIPEKIQSLVLVNRTINDKYTDLKADSLQKIFYRQNFRLDTTIYDLSAIDTMLKATGELLYESGRFDFVIPQNRFLNAQKNIFFTSKMPWDEVKTMCETFQTDAVLSVDMYSTRLVTNYTSESYFDTDLNQFIMASLAQMGVIYEVLFRMYDPIDETIVASEFYKDTLVWEDAARSTQELFQYFTPVKQALAEAGIAAALDFAEKIAPGWREEKRLFYVKGDNNLKSAGTFIDNSQWDQAMALWKETAEEAGSANLKSKAQLNIAIACEIQGNIDDAISWALKSYETMYRPITYRYLEILEQRKKELLKQ